jgi:hydroxymethylglutaryl-CoA synthase
MRGITGWATYLPHWRLDRSAIGAFVGKGGGRGTRTVASYDEDPVTMAVAACRRIPPDLSPDTLWFATSAPPYVEKTNATIVHAALQLDDAVGAFDVGASPRSAMGALLMAARGSGTSLVVAADVRTGLAGSADESETGDGAAAIAFGEGDGRPVLAEVLATVSTSAEFVDRWRTPGDNRSKSWDDKFASVTYAPLVADAWKRALAAAELDAEDVDLVTVAATSGRLASTLSSGLGAKRVASDHAATVGHLGAAQPALLLASALESVEPGQIAALVSAHDGADVLIVRTTDAIADADARRAPTVADQAEHGQALPYGKFLSWRGMLEIEPPRRPEPQRVSASAAARSTDWKFGFVGSRDPEAGSVHLPPSRVSADGTRTDQMEPIAMAGALGTVATFTVDRVAFSPSPPVVFAVVDFDGGGRLPVELCDIDADDVAIGMRVEMTFRRLHTADGIHNYFWKARPTGGNRVSEEES